MELNMLRKALWELLKPLITLITNLLNPEIGEEVLVELKKFNRKEPCWMNNKVTVRNVAGDDSRIVVHLNGVKVPRGLTPKQLVNSLDVDKEWIEGGVVKTMPQYKGGQPKYVPFICLGNVVNKDDLEKELDKLGLELFIDPYLLATINQSDPSFMKQYPNCIQWMSGPSLQGMSFTCCDGINHVFIDHRGGGAYTGGWWFPYREKKVI